MFETKKLALNVGMQHKNARFFSCPALITNDIAMKETWNQFSLATRHRVFFPSHFYVYAIAWTKRRTRKRFSRISSLGQDCFFLCLSCIFNQNDLLLMVNVNVYRGSVGSLINVLVILILLAHTNKSKVQDIGFQKWQLKLVVRCFFCSFHLSAVSTRKINEKKEEDREHHSFSAKS